MTPKQILIAARALINNPKHWTQGEFARDKTGQSVYPDDENATCWCSLGAIDKVEPDYMSKDAHNARSFLRTEMKLSIPEFNDFKSHAEVLDAWDRAIAKASGDQ